jgi:hypothetical protein
MSEVPPPTLEVTGHYWQDPEQRRRLEIRHHREGVVVAMALFVVVILAVCGVFSSSSPAKPLRLSAVISTQRVGRPIAAGFVGLSIEYPALADYLGSNPSRINPVFVALVKALAPGGSPVLRIGGDSTDHSWWPTTGFLPPLSVTYTLTPSWLEATRSLAVATNARLIMGINLAADIPSLAAAEAAAFRSGIGPRYIEAFEIGNEPDIYGISPSYQLVTGKPASARAPGWSMQQFISEFSRWRRAVGPTPVAGPSYAEATWIQQLPAFLRAEPELGLVTDHRYPLRGCLKHPNEAPSATIPHLLADAASAGLAAQVAPYVREAARDRLPMRIDEINSAACEGKPGVSNTFASALWVLDTLFNLQRVGVSGVNIHTLPGAPYEAFTFRHRGRQWTAQVRPIYYGLLAFVRAFPAGARGLLVSAPDGPVKVWATIDGATVRVVVIDESESHAAVVRLRLPGSVTGALRYERLLAPSVDATTGVTLGGRSFGTQTKTGRLAPARQGSVKLRGGEYLVRLPAASAVLLVGNQPPVSANG